MPGKKARGAPAGAAAGPQAPLESFLAKPAMFPEGLFVAPGQVEPWATIRPVCQKTVDALCQAFTLSGYLKEAANIVLYTLSGDLGSNEAKYGIVDGHHRYGSCFLDKIYFTPCA